MTRPVTLPSGITLLHAEQGDPAGVPLILLHGYSDSHRSFEPLLAHLPRDLHAYALTQRGHGDAEKPDGGYAAADLAGDVAGFMDAVGIEAAVIVGHSAGTVTARHLAAARPERVLGLVLIGAVTATADHPGIVEMLGEVEQLTDPVDRAFIRTFQESTIGQPVPRAFLDLVIAESAKLPARVWKAALRGLAESPLPNPAVPTRILWGDEDALFPRDGQEAMAAAIPGAELIVYEGVGHALHWEQPRRAAGDIATFSLRGRLRPRSAAVR